MLVPFCGIDKPATSQKDSIRRFRLVKPFNRTSVESLIGGFAHPTPTKNLFYFHSRGFVGSEKKEGSHIISLAKAK